MPIVASLKKACLLQWRQRHESLQAAWLLLGPWLLLPKLARNARVSGWQRRDDAMTHLEVTCGRSSLQVWSIKHDVHMSSLMPDKISP